MEKVITEEFIAITSALNRAGHESVATVAIQATVNDSNYQLRPDGYKYAKSIDGEFHISDCSRVVSLNIDVANQKERENTIHKLNTLIEAATTVRDWIEGQTPEKLAWHVKVEKDKKDE